MADEIKNTPEVETPDTSKEVGTKEEEKLLTQDQFDKALKERLDRERRKLLKETEAKIKEVQAEAERLAKLSAEEKERELAAKNEEELRNKLRDVSIRENRLDAMELFAKSKVPSELVEYVVNEDRDKTLENAEIFVKTFNESVAKAVAEQLKGTPPKDISVNSSDTPVKRVLRTF